MTGFATSTNPEVPPCVPPVNVLTDVRVILDVAMDGGTWVGRSPSQLGDVELRVQGLEEVTTGIEVSGSIVGGAVDHKQLPFGRRGLVPEFALTIRIGGAARSAASVKGSAERTGRHISGTISGDIEYRNNLGNVTRCTAVTWILQPEPP